MEGMHGRLPVCSQWVRPDPAAIRSCFFRPDLHRANGNNSHRSGGFLSSGVYIAQECFHDVCERACAGSPDRVRGVSVAVVDCLCSFHSVTVGQDAVWCGFRHANHCLVGVWNRLGPVFLRLPEEAAGACGRQEGGCRLDSQQ